MQKNINDNVKQYCAKCLSVVGSRVVIDVAGRKYCSVSCRKDWWAENRKDAEERYNNWI